jgi:hypothetical protein
VWERLHRALLDRLGKRTRSTGRGRLWTRRRCRPPGGRKDRPEPDGQEQTGLQAPPPSRPKRHPAGREAVGGQRPRLEDAGAGGGRDPPDPQTAGSPGKAAQALREAARLLKGYDSHRCRKALRKRGIKARIARRGEDSSERLGRYRRVVERTLSWLNRYRRLRCATRGGPTSTKRSSTSGARWSVGATCNGFVRRIKYLLLAQILSDPVMVSRGNRENGALNPNE